MPEFVFNMHNVRKTLGEKLILDNVTLSFYEGAKIGVVGPNGAGKSTMLKIMAGLEKPNNGEAMLGKGKTVGILQQEPPLTEDKTVIENIEEAVAETKGMLDRFKVTGILATWWDNDRDEMQTISARGFAELVDGWIDLIQDVIEDTETKKTELFDPFEHKLVVRILPDYLEQIDALRAEIARLEAEKEAFYQY